jgi:hypothetical protein
MASGEAAPRRCTGCSAVSKTAPARFEPSISGQSLRRVPLRRGFLLPAAAALHLTASRVVSSAPPGTPAGSTAPSGFARSPLRPYAVPPVEALGLCVARGRLPAPVPQPSPSLALQDVLVPARVARRNSPERTEGVNGLVARNAHQPSPWRSSQYRRAAASSAMPEPPMRCGGPAIMPQRSQIALSWMRMKWVSRSCSQSRQRSVITCVESIARP